MSEPLLFALQGFREYGRRLAAHLGLSLGEHEERAFEDGEFKIRPLESVRGRHAFVLGSLHSEPTLSVNDKLLRLLMFTGALRDASAREITLVLPYLAFARKDRRSQARDPVSLRYLAQMIEAVGADRVVTLEVHNPAAYQNAFRCIAEHLDSFPIFLDWLLTVLPPGEPLTVVSPDTGGYKRAQRFRRKLAERLGNAVEMAVTEKLRGGGELYHGRLLGEVAGSTALIFDDLIVTGSTLAHAARLCKKAGARQVFALAAHGLFHPDAERHLTDPALDKVVVTDTVTSWALAAQAIQAKLTVLDTTAFLAQVVRRIHTGNPLTELFDR
ncbi:ribose-phosphate pyrophosphokinase [Methylothermus subterraneus]